MKKLIVGICLLGCLCACNGGKKSTDTTDVQMELVDSIETAADTLWIEEVEEEPIIPASADESFADFLYNFALDERLQLRRIIFPLPYYMDSRKDSIVKENWVHDPLFSQQEFYTMLYDRLDDAELEKDTASTSVRIEWIDLKDRKMKRYYFERLYGWWKLEAIDDATMPKEETGQEDFFEFYERFANDSLFQAERVVDPLPFVAPDPEDDFQILETTIQKSQWFAFQPKLPRKHLTNVNYGQRLEQKSRTRIIELRGFGNGFSNTLYFRCRNGIWKLTRFEDLSN
ncbi:MAG: DUF4348 domain-containing protein [Bacteroides sp.]|nr:DUF4348 domain-containing protein [Bacteroides sp.]